MPQSCLRAAKTPMIKRSMQRKYAARLATFILAAHLGKVASVLAAEPAAADMTILLSQSGKATSSPRPL